jgi:cytidine deaminase
MPLKPEQKKDLIESAILAREWAYTPYSHYAVGAALLTASGKVYEGVNIENAAFPTTMCAERVAIYKAVSEGEREFTAIAIATENGGSPCGSCRQVLAEFGLQTLIIVADVTGKIHLEGTVEKLLPTAFTPEDLI